MKSGTQTSANTSVSTVILHPEHDVHNSRTPKARLEEACGLARAINLNVAYSAIAPLKRIRPSTYIGKGKIAELAPLIAEKSISLAILNCHLSAVQQRNLEEAWKCKVIDRTALILEIFGERARTSEGKLQVELAALEYQKSRLVRSWTHLERQRGGFGFMGGPGETQIETDRRLLRDRIARIKQQLDKVKKTRALHRESRAEVPYPVVALVGYTNAGKSTLFNRLTGAHVDARDMLFATLDPTMRMITLPSRRKAILSDTVGFISDLPTELIAAFRATLEEVRAADLILHVRDISAADFHAQKQDVLKVLHDLKIEPSNHPTIEIWNKTDLLPQSAIGEKGVISLSAFTGEGCSTLLAAVDEALDAWNKPFAVTIPAESGRLLAWIYEHGEGIETQEQGNMLRIKGRMMEKNLARLSRIT